MEIKVKGGTEKFVRVQDRGWVAIGYKGKGYVTVKVWDPIAKRYYDYIMESYQALEQAQTLPQFVAHTIEVLRSTQHYEETKKEYSDHIWSIL